jgi:hypothetical protein
MPLSLHDIEDKFAEFDGRLAKMEHNVKELNRGLATVIAILKKELNV